MKTSQFFSIYIHIPFCVKRCGYCDFNTYTGRQDLIPQYVQAVCREIELVAKTQEHKLPVHTIYFGGGTPSLLTPGQLDSILGTVDSKYDVTSNAEITLEANPGTIDHGILGEIRFVGFNRISLGVQSMIDKELEFLGRIHSKQDVIESYDLARKTGFENISFDLLYGLPEQKMINWQTSVSNLVELKPEHLSLYSLTVEKGTRFGILADRGQLNIPDDDLAAEMLIWADDYLEDHRYLRYEISNWAKSGRESRHNLQYWLNQPYLGFGAGAHSCFNDMRVSNVLRIKGYIQHVMQSEMESGFKISPAEVSSIKLSPYTRMQETLMLGLRLTRQGVTRQRFRQLHGAELNEVFSVEIGKLMGQGLLEWQDDSLVLTRRGRMLGNRVFQEFV